MVINTVARHAYLLKSQCCQCEHVVTHEDSKSRPLVGVGKDILNGGLGINQDPILHCIIHGKTNTRSYLSQCEQTYRLRSLSHQCHECQVDNTSIVIKTTLGEEHGVPSAVGRHFKQWHPLPYSQYHSGKYDNSMVSAIDYHQ